MEAKGRSNSHEDKSGKEPDARPFTDKTTLAVIPGYDKMKSRCASRMAALLANKQSFLQKIYLSLFVIRGVKSKLHPAIVSPLRKVATETMRKALKGVPRNERSDRPREEPIRCQLI